MFTTLLESRAPHQRRAGSTLLSAVTHGAAIAAIVALSIPGQGDAKLPPPAERKIKFIAIAHPPTTPAPPIHQPSAVHQATTATITHVIVPPINMPTSLPPIDIAGPALTEDNVRIGGLGSSTPGLAGAPVGVDFGGIVDDARVDRSPRMLPGAPEPRYPNSLRSSGITGQVVVRFVVDTLGRAEMAGLTTVETTHVLFADAVREALSRFRFTPGEIAGRKVRTMVQVPFTFAIR